MRGDRRGIIHPCLTLDDVKRGLHEKHKGGKVKATDVQCCCSRCSSNHDPTRTCLLQPFSRTRCCCTGCCTSLPPKQTRPIKMNHASLNFDVILVAVSNSRLQSKSSMVMVSVAFGGMTSFPLAPYAYSDCMVTFATSPLCMVGTACTQPSITCFGTIFQDKNIVTTSIG